ncbi:hypothetical protein Cgig2_012295 [Carnegiea gigantea]|uniref:Uncharacterized protein n=1 Tax=Carnegiea gigantea TaxID=171969 RepID=A0A9Q1GK07_9CARY|nr:hypothetical protein Cgig2_012295 [Carnegiea gigantea]
MSRLSFRSSEGVALNAEWRGFVGSATKASPDDYPMLLPSPSYDLQRCPWVRARFRIFAGIKTSTIVTIFKPGNWTFLLLICASTSEHGCSWLGSLYSCCDKRWETHPHDNVGLLPKLHSCFFYRSYRTTVLFAEDNGSLLQMDDFAMVGVTNFEYGADGYVFHDTDFVLDLGTFQ